MKTLLIVDDSQVIRGKISRAVSVLGLTVVGPAGNGAEALELAREHRPDLVTMDITMPGMDGIECTRQLVLALPEARVLVVSALADKATALEALKQGALGFLNKPFSEQELCEALSELMQETGHAGA